MSFTVTHHVHELGQDGSLGLYIGGANDVLAATTIAVGLYVARQEFGADSTLLIGVVDDTGTVVAFVGTNPQQVDS